MIKFIESKHAIQILKGTRQDLHTLVKLGLLKPKRIHTTRNLYSLKEVNRLVSIKKSLTVNSGVCERS